MKEKLLPLVFLAGAALLIRGLCALPPVRKAYRSALTMLQAGADPVLITDLAFPIRNPKTPIT